MDRPFCKVCGSKHWSNEPHKFAKSVSDATSLEPTRVHDPVGETDTSSVKANTAVRTDAVQAAQEQHGAALVDSVLIPGEPCPTCGKRVGQTSAERMRRHRAKARD